MLKGCLALQVPVYAHVKEVLGKSGRREALEINYMQCALVLSVSDKVSKGAPSEFVSLSCIWTLRTMSAKTLFGCACLLICRETFTGVQSLARLHERILSALS